MLEKEQSVADLTETNHTSKLSGDVATSEQPDDNDNAGNEFKMEFEVDDGWTQVYSNLSKAG